MRNSKISGFYKLPIDERLEIVKSFSGLTPEDLHELRKSGSLDIDIADKMIENVIGTIELPLGVATNFTINGKDYLIPMALEEPSVVAAASNAARLARDGGGFTAESDEPIMIGQIQLLGYKDFKTLKDKIMRKKEEIERMANEADSIIVSLGGGLKDIEVRELEGKHRMAVVHLHVNVKDAMGANVVNTMAEKVSPFIEEITGCESRLKILTNLAVKRLARSRAVWKKETLGEEAIDRIIDAYNFAIQDKYRCATHNKGIMNGIDAVVIATGNDFRAVEAGAHSYAAINGYTSLTHYSKNSDGDLEGSIELPLAVGIVGGSMKANPVARVSLKILGVTSSKELSEVMASVGLAQNFAALRALANEGIQRGHMKLHAKNLAITAGAMESEIEKVASEMVKTGNVSSRSAQEILKGVRENG